MTSKREHRTEQPTGGFTTLDGEEFYRISGYDLMPPFLMSIANDTDLWMFVSSSGGLTAGRVDADGALFPYETADRLHDAHHHTGPVTLISTRRGDEGETLWEPFTEKSRERFRIERNLYKSIIGNRLVFEEINHDLGLAFRYRWSGCDEFGLVRTAELENRGRDAVAIDLLDGLRNILPFGAPLALYQTSSSLVDAYKRSEIDGESKIGIFSLTSRIIDRAEAAEELRANAVWCRGLGRFGVSLTAESIAAFRNGAPAGGGSPAALRGGAPHSSERLLTGRRGNYLVTSSFALEGGKSEKWHIAADVGLGHVRLAALRARLAAKADMTGEIESALERSGENLRRIVGSADGLQLTGHREACAHHFANVLFNNMRGGVFADNYTVPTGDLADFLRTRNRTAACRHETLLEALPAEMPLHDLIETARKSKDPDLERLSLEYLPIYFSRRHGDPSRPWNRFSIRVKNPDGGRALRYEGNWRDIFQNWEALCLSFPRFIPSMIAKFVNASTIDGFNPYRITRDGIDWEVADPDDPWSHIGYWGDHQIVYLLKFLEAADRFLPGALEDLLAREIFCFAEVPYRIKPYEEIVEDPESTIVYDTELASLIERRVERAGTDGKLVHAADGSILRVNLLEKLLIPALSKLSNLVPGGGIWMNTQRPEWNDANNALAGNGLSVVTLCYLRRYLRFLERLLGGMEIETFAISTEVIEWFERLDGVLNGHRSMLDSDTIESGDARMLLDEAGEAFSDYRTKVYASGFSGTGELSLRRILDFCGTALAHVDHSIRLNRRGNGLYHSYNLLGLTEKGIEIGRLYEMLEGQVAVLSSGAVGASEAALLVSSLFESGMYDERRRSFMLYPERELPGFLERNAVPAAMVERVPLLGELLETGDGTILERDAYGVHRFDSRFSNARDLSRALARLAEDTRWSTAVERDGKAVLDLFEGVFHHAEFTGRSGAMYGYEGLGCIYWHMVSKLLLAVQEIALRAAREASAHAVSASRFEELARAYYRIRSGLGFEKTAAEYGAFPTDPYSHTPAHGGARQPGMTGQVKEEILTRFGELGVMVEKGSVIFRPVLLRKAEFLERPGVYRYYDIEGTSRSIDIPAGALAFSFCQVPVVYQMCGERAWIRITAADGTSSTLEGDTLDAASSRALFDRSGAISRIDAGVPDGTLLSP